MFAQLVAGQRIPMYRAYQIAFEKTKPSVATAMTNGPKLAKADKVKLRITQISKESAAKHEWSLDKVVESLTFLHDEAKADLIQNGLRKANADALLESTQELTDVLKLKEASDLVKAQTVKAQAEAEISRAEADEVTGKNIDDDDDGFDSAIDNAMNKAWGDSDEDGI